MAKKSEIQDKLEKLKSILEFNAKISKTYKRPKSELKKPKTSDSSSNKPNLLNSFCGKTEFFTKADKTSKNRDTLKSGIEGKNLII